MGFISCNLAFYRKELQALENSMPTEKTIYRAKQLLKIIDDLTDEGHAELHDALEKDCRGVSILRKYLRDNHAVPFPVSRLSIKESDVFYGDEELLLTEAIDGLCAKAEESGCESDNPFLPSLIRFCEWIGYEKNVAYIFLLRDTLLPYIYYARKKKRTNAHPWLLSRKTLAALTGKENVDDELRAPIFKAVETVRRHCFDAVRKTVLPDVRTAVGRYPEAEKCLTDLLRSIKESRIVVIESGCSGTFPLLLMSLDKRVDMRMYTTYPYLSNIYGDKIFTPEYEKDRLFETLCSQELCFRFSALKNGRFYVRKCLNAAVEKEALAEIGTILR